MGDTLTDAQLIHTLKLRRDLGPGKAAEELGLSPSTFRQRVREAKLRKLTADSTAGLSELERLREETKRLERENKAIRKDNETAEAIRTEIYGLKAQAPQPPAWISAERPANLPGVPIFVWSDWHYGERVFREQTGGANEFNREIAQRRVKRLVDVGLDLAIHHMVNPKYPGCVVCLGGDMISGNIHEELRETNDGTIQQSCLEVQGLLISALKTMADKFGKVFVPCVVGNHGRIDKKPRAKNRVFESFEWNIYCQLELFFKNDPVYKSKIQFMIPSETDCYFTVLGHRFLLTHGDTLGVKGGDGIIGALGPITRGAIKIGRSEAMIGRDFDTLIIGHWHTYIPRGDASSVMVNGALKGYDEYARLYLRVPYSRPSQALFFIHEKHGITAQWPIYLEPNVKKELKEQPWIQWR